MYNSASQETELNMNTDSEQQDHFDEASFKNIRIVVTRNEKPRK